MASSIYLDYNSTTPVDPRVLEKMLPYFSQNFGNSASYHPWGWFSHEAVEKARMQIAQLIGAQKQEIYFTSGATESNNWAIQGIINFYLKNQPQSPIHIISTSVEHNSVLQTLKSMNLIHRVEVDLLPVDETGLISLQDLKNKIKPHTRLISCIWVNNEVGTIASISEIAQIAHENQIYFHTDATQAIGKISVDAAKESFDLLSFSGHKIYGPKGVGVLYIRSKNPHVEMEPILFGGGHEKGLRSGTLNVPGIVGIGEACEILRKNWESEIDHLTKIKTELTRELLKLFPHAKINGHPTLRSCNNLNVTFPGVDFSGHSGTMVRFAVSSGSACTAGQQRSSHVLKELGLSEEAMKSTLRITWGRMSHIEDGLQLLKTIKDIEV